MRVASRTSGALGQNGINLTVVPRTARAKPGIWNPSLTWCARMVGTRLEMTYGNRFILSGQRINQREAREHGNRIRKWRKLEHGSLPLEEPSRPPLVPAPPRTNQARMPRGHNT